MPDNVAVPTPGETPEPTAPATGAVTIESLQAQIDSLQARLTAVNNESAGRRRTLDAYEKAEEDRKQAAMTELEKEREKAKKAERERDEALALANDRVIRASVIAEAAKYGVLHPEDVYPLMDKSGLSVKDGGEVDGIAVAVKALIEAGRLPLSGNKPGAPVLDGGAGGKPQPQKTITLTDTQKYMAQVSGMTEQQYIDYLAKGAEAEKARSLASLPDVGTVP